MPKVLNNLICSVMIFALSFLWVYYCIKSLVWAVTLAAVIATCSAYLIWRIQNKIGTVKTAKQQNKKAVSNFLDFLKYNDDNSAVFAELYRYYGYDVENVDYDHFIARRDNVTTYVCLCYQSDNLSITAIQSAIVSAKRKKTDKLCIYTVKADSPLKKTAAEHFNVEFIDIANAYALLESADKLPDIPNAKPVKNSFVAKYAFSRKRFWWYFGSSVFMTLVSIVAYFPYYTLGWATVMLALALYSLFNTRYNAKQTGVTLD